MMMEKRINKGLGNNLLFNNKGAEMTSKALLGIIILIVSFAVILLLYMSFNWNPTIDRETCHTSIVLRSSVNKGIIQGSKLIPLKCQTEKICLSNGFRDNCEFVFGKSSKTNIITNDKINQRTDVLNYVSDAIYDCHELVGKGLLDFMPHGFTGDNYGLICSRISLTENSQKILRNSGGDIRYLELYDYMSKKNTPDGKSYLEEVYDIKNPEHISKFLQDNLKNLQEKALEEDSKKFAEFSKLTLDDWTMDSSNQQAIVVQIIPAGTWASLTGGAAAFVVVGGIILAIPTGGSSLAASGVGMAALLGGGTAGGFVVAKANPENDYQYLAPTIYTYDVDSLRSLNVDDFAFAP